VNRSGTGPTRIANVSRALPFSKHLANGSSWPRAPLRWTKKAAKMGGLPVCDMRDLAVIQNTVMRTRKLLVADGFESCEGW